MWIYINNLYKVIWLAENWSGRGILIYSAWQGLKITKYFIELSGEIPRHSKNKFESATVHKPFVFESL